MRNVLLVLIAAAGLFGALTPTRAALPIVSTDIGLESSTDITMFPSSISGTVVRSCSSCTTGSTTHRLTSDTTYFIGRTQVTLAQLSAYAKTGSYALTIFVKPNDTSVITRIVIPRD